MKIAIVASHFHEWLTDRLVEGAVDELTRAGVNREDITIIQVAGAFELPWGIVRTLKRIKPDGVIAIGVIIKGETDHHDYIARSVFNAIQELVIHHDIPITCGILTTQNTLQAMERTGGKHGHKGREAARALLTCLRNRSLNS